MGCLSCILMNERLKKIPDNIAQKCQIISLDYDLDADEVDKYNPGKTFPVFIIEKDGKEIDRLCGEVPEQKLIDFMKGNI